MVCLDAMDLACGFGFEGPNPNFCMYILKRDGFGRFEASKPLDFKSSYTWWYLSNSPARFYVLLQADALFYVLLQAEIEPTIDPSAQVCITLLISSSLTSLSLPLSLSLSLSLYSINSKSESQNIDRIVWVYLWVSFDLSVSFVWFVFDLFCVCIYW